MSILVFDSTLQVITDYVSPITSNLIIQFESTGAFSFAMNYLSVNVFGMHFIHFILSFF